MMPTHPTRCTMRTLTALGLATAATLTAQATEIQVDVANNAPAGGVFITPIWVGFHDGSFDSYDGGLSAQTGLERLAEDGNTSVISGDFLAGNTYVQGGASGVFSTSQTTGRVDGTIASPTGPPPIAPGETVSQTFDLDLAGDNQYFSYASMILPTNDYFIANGNAFAHDLSVLDGAAVGTTLTIFIGLTVNDAGTEVNDFANSAGNGLFSQLNLGPGQGGANTGADENGTVANVNNPFAGFLNTPSDFNTNPGAELIDFSRTDLYPNGVAAVTFTVVPEPSSLAFLTLGGMAMLRRRR